MSDRVGPFEVVREVLSAPGASLAEAKDATGQVRLVQIMRLRAVDNDEDREKRQKQEKVLAQRTMELIGDSEIVVHAHGGADGANGERVLFWALPYSETPLLVERVKQKPLASAELILLGVQLAERMAARHATGRVEPLLSEHLIRWTGDTKPEVVGAPLSLDADWVAPSMIPALLAPEEMKTQDRRPSGDVWRLGKLLAALACHTQEVSEPMRATFDKLAEDDLEKRISSATTALEALSRLGDPESAVFAPFLSNSATPANGTNGELPNMMLSTSWEISVPDRAASFPNTPSQGTAARAIEEITARARALVADTVPEHDSEAVTNQSEPQTPVLSALPSILVDRTEDRDTGPTDRSLVAPSMPQSVNSDTVRAIQVESFSARDTQVDAPIPVKMPEPSVSVMDSIVPRMVESTERVEPATPIPSQAAVFLIAPQETTKEERGREPEAPKPIVVATTVEKKTNGNGHHPAGPVDPIAASWAQPVLPVGESPWSEVVHARGAVHRDRSEFPGFPDEIPVPARSTLEPRVPAYEAPSLPELPELDVAPKYAEVPTNEIEVELAAALKGIDKKKMVSGVLVALVILGLFALISRAGVKQEGVAPRIVTGANEVALDSNPPGATVVAEADGTILGKTPMRFLVAPGSEVAVYLVAPSREPLRLALPSRGGITAQLSPIDASDCVVKVTAPNNVELEGVDTDIGTNAERHLPGAAVVRAKADQDLRGARLVLCPALGGEKEQELKLERTARASAVRVTQPEGAAAYLNGDPIGPVPGVGRTNAAFSRVRIDDQNGVSEERWVSTVGDTEVRMPAPKTKPVAHVSAPDFDREPGDSPEGERVAEMEKDADEDAKLIQTSNAAKQKMTKAQRVIRARRLLKTGTKMLFAGKIERAKESLVECVELDPSASECHRSLGMLYRKARAPNKAREHFTRYLEISPNAPDAQQIKKMIEK